MSTREVAFNYLVLCGLLLLVAPSQLEAAPEFGQPVSAAELAAWDITILPDGSGLPPGKGSVSEGEAIYAAKCAACHGAKGTGGLNDALVGGTGSLAPGNAPVKTVGSYWPYATTLFDYVRRAMPFPATQSLSASEVYAVSAYILSLNSIVGPNDMLDAASLARVRMPNRDGFVPFPRNRGIIDVAQRRQPGGDGIASDRR
jgi:S-disulfanyl-L-cysteine oxidoreductase SoxD